MRERRVFGQAEAQEIAVQSLTFIVSDSERIARFLALTGLEPETIRESARSPAFLAAVLDHVMGDEALLIDCAKALGVRPEQIARAHHLLSPTDLG